MVDLLNKIMNHLNRQVSCSFGFGNENYDGVSVNIVGASNTLKSYNNRTTKIYQFTCYCLFKDFKKSFETVNDLYNYLETHRIIDNQLKITNVNGPTRVPYKQNKHLFIVEFSVLGL